MAREEPKINLRVPQELKDKITSAAQENNRSINAEINYRLEQSFEPLDGYVSASSNLVLSMADLLKTQNEMLLKYKSTIDDLKNKDAEEEKK